MSKPSVKKTAPTPKQRDVTLYIGKLRSPERQAVILRGAKRMTPEPRA